MGLYDHNPLAPPDPNSDTPTLASAALASSPEAPVSESLGGDPISFAAAAPCKEMPFLPEDLGISWSWVHLIVFLIFGFSSLLIVQVGALLLFSANKPLTQNQLHQMIESKPQF